MLKNEKEYTISIYSARRATSKEVTGTLEYLLNYFSYTLETGKSYEHEKGNKKINLQPKTAKSLVTNLNNAKSNAAANGYSDTSYSLV